MTIAWRTPVVGAVPLASTITVNLTGFSIGDLMLVAIAAQNGAASCTPPPGWTEVHDLIGASAVLGASYYRIKTGTEGSTAVFTTADDASWNKAYAAVAAYDSSGPLAISAVGTPASIGDSGNTGISLPAIPAPGASGYMGIAFACPRGQTAPGTAHIVSTNPTGWTKVAAQEPVMATPYLHPAIFVKENIASGGETPSGGVWSDNNYEANAVIALKVVPAFGSASKVKFGTGLGVTDEGSGVVRVDSSAPVVKSHTQRTSDLVISGSSSGSPTDVVISGAATYEAIRTRLEFFCAAVQLSGTWTVIVGLYDGTTLVNRLAALTGSGTFALPLPLTHYLTPSVGSHNYGVKAWLLGGSATFSAGNSTGDLYIPSYLRITPGG